MQSLFPSTSEQQRNGQILFQFKAGKCDLAEIPGTGKFRVTPDSRKGSISLNNQEGLIKFKWTDRKSNSVVDDFIVFPEEVTLKRINTGRENDRVYLLKWNQGTRKLIFWMQDKSNEKDEANCKKFNELVSNPQPSQGNWMQRLINNFIA